MTTTTTTKNEIIRTVMQQVMEQNADHFPVSGYTEESLQGLARSVGFRMVRGFDDWYNNVLRFDLVGLPEDEPEFRSVGLSLEVKFAAVDLTPAELAFHLGAAMMRKRRGALRAQVRQAFGFSHEQDSRADMYFARVLSFAFSLQASVLSGEAVNFKAWDL